MRRFLPAFGVIFSALVAVPALAAEELALPRLPAGEFPLIPDNAGMRFFEGVWQPLGRNSFSITKTVTVTDKTISWDDIDYVRPYRLLAERENYVLFASYDRVGGIEYDYWTRFVIVYMRYYSVEREGHPEQADMVYNSCSDDRLKNGEKDFRLPKAALLRIFATSYCRKKIGATKPPTRLWLAEGGWSILPFARYAFSDGGIDWQQMQRNRKVLGRPPGTVPDPKN